MSKFVLCSVLIVVLMSMCQPINSFGIVRVDVQQDPALYNAIGSAISSKIQSWNSILSSLLAIKSSYKTVNVNYGSNVASSSGSSVSSGSSGSSNTGLSNSRSTNVVYTTLPLYTKYVNVNYGVAAAPIANTIEDSSDDDDTSSSSSASSSPSSESSAPSSSSSTTSDNSVVSAGQTIYTATKIIGGVPAPAPAASSSVSTVSSGSATVVVPSNAGYSYTKVVG